MHFWSATPLNSSYIKFNYYWAGHTAVRSLVVNAFESLLRKVTPEVTSHWVLQTPYQSLERPMVASNRHRILHVSTARVNASLPQVLSIE